jgi:Tfp pilus assembly protein PilX
MLADSHLRAQRTRRAQRGVLLMDAMVAISFFGVTLGAWAMLVNSNSRTIGEAERRFRAVQAAESMIAEARDNMRPPGHYTLLSGPTAFDAELRLEPREDGLKELTAIIGWTEPGRRAESVRVSTMLR